MAVAAPVPKAAQANDPLSIAWKDELRECGDFVAHVVPGPAKVDLLVSNMSSLSPDQVAAVDDWLKTMLANHRLRTAGNQTAEANVNVTLSEGVNGFVLVAQVRRGADEQTAIFPVDKDGTPGKRVGGVALEDQLIWEQPGKTLDFALIQGPTGDASQLIVLEVGRLAFYTRNAAQWQLANSITIPPMRPWLRAPRGYIDLSHGITQAAALLSGVECKGDFSNPSAIECNFVSQESAPWAVQDAWKSRVLESAGDASQISLECDSRPVALATGGGDWTQTDFIQGYEIGTQKGQGAMASGNPIEFKGPITALWSNGTTAAARVVMQNLQTGNFEAHLVTATCSH